MVSAVDPGANDGGGWASRKLIHYIERNFGNLTFSVRRKDFYLKFFYLLQGIILLPFLHSVFTRYLPLNFIFRAYKNSLDGVFFNFSQSFGGVLFFKRSYLVCHDLQCHRKFFFKKWVRSSEMFLLRRALRVVVLSDRDAKIVRRLYGVASGSVISLQDMILSDVADFSVSLGERDGPVRIVFLGSLLREENMVSLQWFSSNVYSQLDADEVVVDIIGDNPIGVRILNDCFNYIGYVDDLHSTLLGYDFMIAPMLSSAGVKIKVIEALELKLPVLGTCQAYSGIPKPNNLFCSNDPSVWVETIRTATEFSYKK